MEETTVHAGLKFSPRSLKTVLIALDYEPSAQLVAETGYSLASSLGAEVVLVHVIADPVYYSSREYSPVMGFTGFIGPDVAELVGVDELKIASRDYLNISKHHLGDDTIRTMVVEGDTADAILNAATEINADIIVLGSHSRRGLDKILMGSVAEQVLHKTKVPLVIIPTREKE